MFPRAGLLMSGDMLYGTTENSVYAINKDGWGFQTLSALSSGQRPFPRAALSASQNTLFGTTVAGGTAGNGTVFSIGTDGQGFRILHEFSAISAPTGVFTNIDGVRPAAELVLSGNVMYGTTMEAGVHGSGTLFAINLDGSDFRVLHSFSGADGHFPAGILLSGSSLYGTTQAGGGSDSGVFFCINTNGTGFRVLYDFAAGSNPSGGLVLSGTTFYGTTIRGGNDGSGTVYSISLAPQLTIAVSGTNVVLKWPASSTGFSLQSGSDLGSQATWKTVTTAPVVVDGNNAVTLPVAARHEFYRLIQ
jgi:uncharacterized repeat protein (TIGR03803 family)